MESLHQSSKFPQPRSEVENMKMYSAPLEGRRGLLRLDFNENTIGPSPLVIEALKAIPSNQISIYPEYNGLKEAVVQNLISRQLSKHIDSSQIGIFNGVDAAIHAIFHAYCKPNDNLLTTNPTFGYYSSCASMQGMLINAISYHKENFLFPYEQIYKALLDIKPKLLIICNPNNPTGTRLNANKILSLCSASPETLVVIDELYEAFNNDSVLPHINFNNIQNLLVLQSLSKTAGLAGLRIGFAIGYSEVVDRISRVTGPYDINSFAVTAALAALKDQAYIDDYVNEVLVAKKWIKQQLILHNIEHHMDGGNYFLIWPKQSPKEIEISLKSKNILIRSMEGKTLLNGSIRVSIGTMPQMEQFIKAFLAVEQNYV